MRPWRTPCGWPSTGCAPRGLPSSWRSGTRRTARGWTICWRQASVPASSPATRCSGCSRPRRGAAFGRQGGRGGDASRSASRWRFEMRVVFENISLNGRSRKSRVVVLDDSGVELTTDEENVVSLDGRQKLAARLAKRLDRKAEGLAKTVEEGYTWVLQQARAEQQEQGSSPPAEDGRPEIAITVHEREVNDAAIAALAADPGVYQRGGVLVRVTCDQRPEARGIRRP